LDHDAVRAKIKRKTANVHDRSAAILRLDWEDAACFLMILTHW